MEGINKIISLFLGLIVVMILFAIITGRFNPFKGKTTTTATKVVVSVTPTPTKEANKKFLGIFDLGSKKTPTSTPTPTLQKVVVTTSGNTNDNHTYNTTTVVPTKIITKPTMKSVSSIPSTGSPTALLPLIGSAFLAGTYLRRKK